MDVKINGPFVFIPILVLAFILYDFNSRIKEIEMPTERIQAMAIEIVNQQNRIENLELKVRRALREMENNINNRGVFGSLVDFMSSICNALNGFAGSHVPRIAGN